MAPKALTNTGCMIEILRSPKDALVFKICHRISNLDTIEDVVRVKEKIKASPRGEVIALRGVCVRVCAILGGF